MGKNDEGIGRLSAEDIAAIQGTPSTESAVDVVRKMIADSEARIDAAEKEARKAIVLSRAATIAAAVPPTNRAWPEEQEHIASWTFDLLAALDEEYKRRYE